MLFPRKIQPRLEERIQTDEIVVVTGMRRVGKTTLLNMLMDKVDSENKTYLDLGNPLNQAIFEEKDYNRILDNLKAFGLDRTKRMYLFLDEIQEKPDIVKAVKYLYDHYKIKFFLTGSSSYYLKNMFPESLAGRKALFDLRPLDFEEFLVFKGIQRDEHLTLCEKAKEKNRVVHERLTGAYSEYIEFGGFPQVVLERSNSRKREWLIDIFKSYYEKDVRLIADFKNLNSFRDLCILLMQRLGSKIEITKLSSELGVSRDTVYSYLGFLQNSYFLDQVKPFSRNADREVSGSRKAYACDTGLASVLGKTQPGSLFENSVYLNIRNFGEIRYYERRASWEIDFVIPGLQTCIEVKTSAREQDMKLLKERASVIGMKEHFLVTKGFSGLTNSIPCTSL